MNRELKMKPLNLLGPNIGLFIVNKNRDIQNSYLLKAILKLKIDQHAGI